MSKFFALLGLFVVVSCAPQPEVTKRKMISLLQKFDLYDYNGDGHLDESELRESEKRSGIPAAEIIEFYDTGKDGRISLAEATAGLSRIDEAQELVRENAR